VVLPWPLVPHPNQNSIPSTPLFGLFGFSFHINSYDERGSGIGTPVCLGTISWALTVRLWSLSRPWPSRQATSQRRRMHPIPAPPGRHASRQSRSLPNLSNVSFFQATLGSSVFVGTTFPAPSFGRHPCDQLSMIVATSFEPIIQRPVGLFPKVAFKAALAAQPGKVTCPRSGNDEPCRLDLAVLDDF
jgi:hypothetical protein